MTLKSLGRNTFILTVWSVVFFYWLYWFMNVNWGFNIFYAWHWQYIYQQWWYDGWVIQGAYFWFFVLALALAVPLWIIGFCFFASVNYKGIFERLFWNVIYQNKTKKVQANDKKIRVRKKRSYKEVRPKALSNNFASVNAPRKNENLFMDPVPAMGKKDDAFGAGAHFSHRELPEDMTFGMGGNPYEEKSSPFAEKTVPMEQMAPLQLSDEPPKEVLREDIPALMAKAGCQVMQDVVVDEMPIDYLAFANGKMYICQKDAEVGDWLADEERFNDEDPLWFSESSHRVSPLTVLKQKRDKVLEVLSKGGIALTGQGVLIKNKGNIINAEDMMDTWQQMDMIVCRTQEGQPVELPSFEQAFPTPNEVMDAATFAQVSEILGGK